LKRPDFAKSVVGRTGRFPGATIIRPFSVPLMIRTGGDRMHCDKNVREEYQNHM
jgi:hypothetical protein